MKPTVLNWHIRLLLYMLLVRLWRAIPVQIIIFLSQEECSLENRDQRSERTNQFILLNKCHLPMHKRARRTQLYSSWICHSFSTFAAPESDRARETEREKYGHYVVIIKGGRIAGLKGSPLGHYNNNRHRCGNWNANELHMHWNCHLQKKNKNEYWIAHI